MIKLNIYIPGLKIIFISSNMDFIKNNLISEILGEKQVKINSDTETNMKNGKLISKLVDEASLKNNTIDKILLKEYLIVHYTIFKNIGCKFYNGVNEFFNSFKSRDESNQNIIDLTKNHNN